MEQKGDAGLAAASRADCTREVDLAFGQALHGDAPHLIAAGAGDEAGPHAEQRDIMSEDRRGAAERQLEVAGEHLAIERDGFRKSVEDEVEVDFSGDGEVEVRHAVCASSGS